MTKWITKQLFWPIQTSSGSFLAADNKTSWPIHKTYSYTGRNHLNRNLKRAGDFLRNVWNHHPQLWMNMRLIFQEFKTAMKQNRSGKSPGSDHIPFKMIKHGGLPLQTCIFILILKMIQNTNSYTSKNSDREAYRNYRGTLLLSITGKVFAMVLLNQLTPKKDHTRISI